MLRRWIVAVLCVLFVGALGQSRAEVRVKTTPTGGYAGTEVYMSLVGTNLLVWTPRRGATARPEFVLNPMGDVYNDTWPKIVDNSVAPHYPYVVWSRLDDTDYDLVWSEWEPGGWKDVQLLTEDPSDAGDDLGAYLDFDAQGQPYLFWWRNESGTGVILFSMQVSDGWTYPYRVSDPGVDSRHPAVLGFPQSGGVLVDYETPTGRLTQLLLVTRPDSITEDIDPLITVTTVDDEGGQ